MEQDYVVKLHKDLCNVLNESPMPISIKYFILKDLINEIQFLYDNYCKQLQQQQQLKLSEEEEEQKENVLTNTKEEEKQ